MSQSSRPRAANHQLVTLTPSLLGIKENNTRSIDKWRNPESAIFDTYVMMFAKLHCKRLSHTCETISDSTFACVRLSQVLRMQETHRISNFSVQKSSYFCYHSNHDQLWSKKQSSIIYDRMDCINLVTQKRTSWIYFMLTASVKERESPLVVLTNHWNSRTNMCWSWKQKGKELLVELTIKQYNGRFARRETRKLSEQLVQ